VNTLPVHDLSAGNDYILRFKYSSTVALPGVAQQVQTSLLRLEAAQVVDGVEVRQARVVEQVLGL
jgi:hypothetical protein